MAKNYINIMKMYEMSEKLTKFCVNKLFSRLITKNNIGGHNSNEITRIFDKFLRIKSCSE